MNDTARTTYRVIQKGQVANVPVSDFDSLVTHHPGSNRSAHMEGGIVVGGERGRLHAYIGGEVEEVEVARSGRTYGLKPDQVLIKKDFILEHPAHPKMSAEARNVDVPSPVAGYVGRVDAAQGLVDVFNKPGGDVIARVRHMRGITVAEQQTVEYGQSLGTQSDVKTGAKHVHMEMDTRYYQQYENYISDLVSGRLPVEAAQRAGVQPRRVTDDGVIRLGESSERVADLQRVMAGEGYRAAGGGPLDQDGVYRLGMQGALLDFQRAHGLPQTGDIDAATLGMAPPAHRREADRDDYTKPGMHTPSPVAEPRAPGHPDHPDHRPGLSSPLPPPVNQPVPGARRRAGLNASDEAMLEQIRAGVRGLDQEVGKGWDEQSERLTASALMMAKEKGFTAGDDLHLAFNKPTDRFAGGEILHLARTGPHASIDPAANRAHMPMAEALSQPAEERYRQVEAMGHAQAEAMQLAQQQGLAHGMDDPSRSGPRFTM